MKVRTIYTPTIVRGAPTETLAEAAQRMVRSEVGALVLYRGGEPAGIITERDVLRAIADGTDPWTALVDDHMTPDPATIPLDADLSEAAATMLRLGTRHLLVRDADRIVGMLSARDVLIDEAWPAPAPAATTTEGPR